METTDWRLISGDGPVTVLVRVVLVKAEVSADGLTVRGRTEQGHPARLPAEWLAPEDRERVRAALEGGRGD